MSLECQNIISEAHSKSILCVQCNASRREIYTAGEDSLIKVWDSDTSKLLSTLTFHTGWVTNLLIVDVNKVKILFSVSIDGFLVAWSCQTGKLMQKIQTGAPIYSLAFNSRRTQLLAGSYVTIDIDGYRIGFYRKVRVFQFLQNEDGHPPTNLIETDTKPVICDEHQDVVSCMVSCEGRYYSGGYDRKIVIYDVAHHGDLKLKVSKVVKEAHESAITCMIFGKDADNSWLITGSFDRVVKLWSLDGSLLQRFDGFSDTIVSFTYVLPMQTLWISANSSSPIIFDPKSGINVTDHTSIDAYKFNTGSNSFCFKQLLFVAETNQVIGLTNRKSIVIWKFNQNAAITVLGGHSDSVQCLTFTNKEPVLIFSGADDGFIRKYERLQLNTFMYSQETLSIPREDLGKLKGLPEKTNEHSHSRASAEDRRRQHASRHKEVNEKLESWKRSTISIENMVHGKQIELVSKSAEREFKKALSKSASRYHHSTEKDKPALDEFGNKIKASHEFVSKIKPSFLTLYYYEELDIIVAGSEDCKIYIFGYNEEAVDYKQDATDGLGHTLSSTSFKPDSVTNRVAGMSLKYTLKEHKDAVSSVVCFQRDGVHWLLSTGWDRRICLWDLGTGKLRDIFRQSIPRLNARSSNEIGPPRKNSISSSYRGAGAEELCADDIVLGIDYSADRGEFCYCSADKLAYVRNFSPNGSDMILQVVLQGHEADVTQVKWNKINQTWITGSKDRTIRIWPGDGIPCLRVINNESPVTSLCIDVLNGCIVSGAEDHIIRVFDPSKNDEVVQKNIGHTDEVSAIVHVAIRNQYVSGSWDNTVRVWNSYIKSGQRKGHSVTKSSSAAPEEVGQGININSLIGLRLTQYTAPISGAGGESIAGTTMEEFSQVMDQARLEEDLKLAFSDMEHALEDQRGRTPKMKIKANLPDFSE